MIAVVPAATPTGTLYQALCDVCDQGAPPGVNAEIAGWQARQKGWQAGDTLGASARCPRHGTQAAPPPVLVTLRLTAFQADEVQHGLDIDDADGTGDWGLLEETS